MIHLQVYDDQAAEPHVAEDQEKTEGDVQAPPNPTAPTHETAGAAAANVQTPPSSLHKH